MQVAIFIPTLKGGGAEKAAVNLANGLTKLNIKVYILTGDSNGVNKVLLDNSVEVVDFKVSRLVKSFKKYIAFIQNNEIDYVISFLNHTNILSGLVKCIFPTLKTKFITTLHSITSNTIKDTSIKEKIYKWFFTHFALNNSNSIICVSETIKKDLIENFVFKNQNLDVIYNPVFKEEELLNLQKKSQSLNKDCRSIVSVGRLEAVKDFPTLIRAISYLKENRGISFQLDIFGEGSERKGLEELIENLNVGDLVRLRGYSENILEEYGKYCIFVSTSINEGFGNVIIEAVAANLKIICCKESGAPTELLQKAEQGMFFTKNNYEELADIILNCIESVPAENSIDFSNQFTDTYIAQKYLEHMKEL